MSTSPASSKLEYSRLEFGAGIAFWAAFCTLAVILRGYRWEESVGYAEVLSRQVLYPEAHPFFRYVHNAYSLQVYASAAVMAFIKDAILFCYGRNILHLLATVLPIFMLTHLLSRKPMAAHAAALLALSGLLHEFDGTYPISAWPGLGSIGHFGNGYALLVLCFLASGRWKWSFFLLGAMPCIHLGHMPVLLMTSAVIAGFALLHGDAAKLKGPACAFAAGLGLCFVFWIVMQFFRVSDPTAGAYFSELAPEEAWRNYLAKDGHRSLPIGGTNVNSHFALLAMIILGFGAMKTKFAESRDRKAWFRIVVYSSMVSATVWCMMLVHMAFGTKIPFLMIVWMPYRLANHIPFILLACIPAILCRSDSSSSNRYAGNTAILAMLLLFVLRPWLQEVVDPNIYGRYLATGDIAAFFLYGASFAALVPLLGHNKPFLKAWAATSAVTLATFAVFHQFGAVCCVSGALAFWALDRIPSAKMASHLTRGWAYYALCLLLTVSLLHQQYTARSYEPVSEFGRQIAQKLEDEENPGGLVATPPFQLFWQTRIGHSVLEGFNLESIIGYMPNLGPSIYKMYREVYGLDLRAPEEQRKARDHWREVWEQRTQDEWKELGKAYSIGYVLVQGEMQLDLPEIFREPAGALYRIPIEAVNGSSTSDPPRQTSKLDKPRPSIYTSTT